MFGSRVAHGMLGVSIATGLITQLGTLDDTAMGLLEFNLPIQRADSESAIPCGCGRS